MAARLVLLVKETDRTIRYQMILVHPGCSVASIYMYIYIYISVYIPRLIWKFEGSGFVPFAGGTRALAAPKLLAPNLLPLFALI